MEEKILDKINDLVDQYISIDGRMWIQPTNGPSKSQYLKEIESKIKALHEMLY